ncbi:MAG TPA: hypothetical protein VMS08_05150, partial [Candidatus Saccharimonadia bacterium]|nr:hypothetical protein [Candidatus Saccharimonadia bacterium]
MSRCFTLRRTGFDGPIELSNGIVVDRSSTPHWPNSIDVGRDHEYDYGPEVDYDLDYRELVTRWITLPMDRKRPPALVECRDGTWRMVRASIIDVGERKFARAEYPGQGQVLVLINTRHTEPCETGGYWVAKSGHPEVVMHGKQGQRTYKVYHRGGSLGFTSRFDEPVEEVDERAAWS